MVDLTRLDSNKFKAILRFKRQIADSFDKPSDAIISHGASEPTRRLNTFGEMEALQVDQRHKDLSDKEIDDIVAGYLSGKSTYALAEKFGCHRRTVTKALEKRGIVVDKRKAMKKLDEERVVALYAAMHTIEEIAKQFNVSANTITRCLKNHGVKMRNRWDYINK